MMVTCFSNHIGQASDMSKSYFWLEPRTLPHYLAGTTRLKLMKILAGNTRQTEIKC